MHRLRTRCSSSTASRWASRPTPPRRATAGSGWPAGTGVLHTGHALFDVRDGAVVGRDIAVAVHGRLLRQPDRRRSSRPTSPPASRCAVAGAFTLDGLGAPFVAGVDGDPATVVGLSLPLLRTQLAKRRALAITDLWRR